ncbi:MAG: hypothetical protein IKQ61_11845 [Spirochaetales bacterium]|nr:hypothetical protein [Spirochaetales bacterium]
MKKIKLGLITVMMLCIGMVYAQESFLSEYVSRRWSSDDGLPTNTITSMVQDYLGYIYMGSYAGLIKFDGVKFSVLNRNTSKVSPFISARVVMEDSKRRLWIGSNDEGLAYQNAQRSSLTLINEDLPSKSIRSIIEGNNGDIWIGTSNGVVVYDTNNNLSRIGGLEYNGLQDATIVRLYCDIYGSIWATTTAGNVYRYTKRDGAFKIYKPKFLQGVIASIVFQDSMGYMWFGLRNNSVYRIKTTELFADDADIHLQQYVGQEGFISQSEINTFMEDDNKNIWIGTQTGIIYVSFGGHVEYYTENEGLINNSILKIFKDREDNIWIGTNLGGIEKLTKVRFHSIPTESAVNCITEDTSRGRFFIGTDSGLICYNGKLLNNEIVEYFKHRRIRDLAWSKDGTLMVSTYSDAGVVFIKDGNIKSISSKNGLSIDRCRVALELHDGRIAVGTAKGLNILTRRQDPNNPSSFIVEKIEVMTKIDGLTNDFIMCLYEDNNHVLWVGTDGGGVNLIRDGKIFDVIDTDKGLAGNVIFKIMQDKKGSYWICTGSGVTKYDLNADHFVTFNMAAGLPADSIFQILFDQNDMAWFVTNSGLCSVPAVQLDMIAEGRNIMLETKLYNKNDGLFPSGLTSTSLSCMDSRGCLWFPMATGFTSYNPSASLSSVPPLVYIEKISTEEQTFNPYDSKIDIPANANRITIDFVGLSYVSLERVGFKYQLIGFDTTASKVTSQRQVSYTNLPAGKYTFSVSTVNGDGVWSTAPAQITFVKQVYFYQTIWFAILCVLTAAGLFALFYVVRMSRMKKQQLYLERVVDERTKDLQIEKDKSEALLLNILPRPIADQLKDTEEIIADSFAETSVLFADIVGFTKLSSTCTPHELVLYLNDLFTRFDLRAENMGVEKIKTIGDCYMAACGVPEANPKHALVLLEFARGMLNDIKEYNETAEMKVGMRIGISSGTITAGVIGKTKFIYDIWGDTVNTASRMEHYGKEGLITVSQMTYDLIKDEANLIGQEEQEIKGKGLMHIYRVM